MERGGGIVSTVKVTRACNFIQLRSKAEGFLKQMSAMGVTTVEGKSGYGLDKETELLQLRVMRSLNNDEHKRVDVVSTFLGAHAVPAEYNGQTDEYVDYIIREVMPVVFIIIWQSSAMSSVSRAFSPSSSPVAFCWQPRKWDLP